MTISTSMRTPSLKSALPSPSAGPTLTSSRSTRRLRGSGSVKGAQSPGLFASVGSGGSRRRGGGGGFETAEPTSPKVTCIGQVRVKTGRKMLRKKKKKPAAGAASFNRSRSRRVAGGDMGYRSAGVQGGICDAVRAFGSEINCFLLCGAGGGRSSVCCSGTDREKPEAGAGGKRGAPGMGGSSSCGAAFARWIMAVHETEDDVRRREVAVEQADDCYMGRGPAVEAEEEGTDDEELVEERQFRRGIRALELLADELEKKGADFSNAPVCAPPKNALLLMRCRADPVKLSALENRFREAKVVEVEDEEEDAAAAAVAAGGALQDGNNGGRAKDVTLFTRQVPELEAKDHNFAATVTRAMEDRPEHHGDKTSSSNGPCEGVDVTEEELEEKKEKEAQDSGEGGDIAIPVLEKVIEEDDNFEQVEESNLGEETDEGEEKRVVLVESLQAADDSEAAKENKQVVLLPLETADATQLLDKSEKKLVRRDLLLAGGEMEGRRWSFSKERKESSVDGGARRHSFSTEEARRSSSFREKDGTRRSSFSHDAVNDAIRRSSSFSSSDRGSRDRDGGAGRRGRRSISKEKDPRRRSVDVSAEQEAMKKLGAVREPRATAATSSTSSVCRGGFELSETAAAAGRTSGGRDGVVKRRGECGQGCDDDGKELPDCLLLMMYEPKLSMEISKETWVCTDDFQRWKPHHHRRPQQQHRPSSSPKPRGEAEQQGSNVEEDEAKVTDVLPDEEGGAEAAAGGGCDTQGKQNNEDGTKKKRPPLPTTTTEAVVTAPPHCPSAAATRPRLLPPQPPSAPPELASKPMERKLDSVATTAAITVAALGPFALTRCKSEPMRNSPRLLLPEDYCFWKSHHHQHAVGAAGIGFGF